MKEEDRHFRDAAEVQLSIDLPATCWILQPGDKGLRLKLTL